MNRKQIKTCFFLLFLFSSLICALNIRQPNPVSAAPDIIIFNCNSFSAATDQWLNTGTSPYLDAIDAPTNIIANPTGTATSGNYGFEDTPYLNCTISAATLLVHCSVAAGFSFKVFVYYEGGDYGYPGFYDPGDTIGYASNSSYWTREIDISAKINDQQEIDYTLVKFVITGASDANKIKIDWVAIRAQVTEQPVSLPYDTFLPVNSYINTTDKWVEVGAAPWLNATDFPANYIKNDQTGAPGYHSAFGFQDLTPDQTIVKAAKLRISCMVYVGWAFNVSIFNGTAWYQIAVISWTHMNGWWNFTFDISAYVYTAAAMNATRLRFWDSGAVTVGIYVDHAALLSYTRYVGGYDIDMLNLEGCGNWVFAGPKLYYFNATYEHYISASLFQTLKLGFYLRTADGLIWIETIYSRSSGLWTYSLTPGVQLPPIQISAGESSTAGKYLSAIFKLRFTERCVDVATDDCVDLWLWANDTAGEGGNWTLLSSDAFKLYVRGGSTDELSTATWGSDGQAGRLGGGLFDFYAYNGSQVSTGIYYRHLQHVKMRPLVQCIVGYPQFYVEYGVDYCTQTEDWITGWRIRMTAESVVYQNPQGGGERYFNWTVQWFWNNSILNDQTTNIIMHHGGGAAAAGEDTWTWFWIDLWFGQVNASSIVCGRVNAYEWAIKDNSAWWVRWLSTNWGIKDEYPKEAMFFHQLTNSTGAVISTAELKMIKLWSKVWCGQATTPGQAQFVRVEEYQVFDMVIGDLTKPMEGVPTPSFEETITPVMPQGGWVGVIAAGLRWLGQQLSDNIIYGGLSVWPHFVAFMDTLAGAVGYPGAFTNFMTWLGQGWVWLSDSFGYLISLVAPLFIFLGAGMSKFATLVGTTVTYWVQILQGIWSYLDGVYVGGQSTWEALNMWTWIQVGIVLYPIYLIILWDTAGWGAVERQLRLIWDVMGWLYHFFMAAANLIITLFVSIIEAIPVIE